MLCTKTSTSADLVYFWQDTKKTYTQSENLQCHEIKLLLIVCHVFFKNAIGWIQEYPDG